MRDINKKILLILWAVILVFLVFLLVTRKTSHKYGVNIDYYDGDDYEYSDDPDMLYRKYTYSASDIKSFDVDMVSADVEVTLWDGDEVVLSLVGNGWRPELDPVVSVERGRLSVKIPKVSGNNAYKGRRVVFIEVPESVLSTAFEGEFTTISGDILLLNVAYDDLSANSTSGDISIAGTISNLDANTVSGEINANGVYKTMNCKSVSGDIKADAGGQLSGKSTYGTVSGNIRLDLSECESYELEWQTMSGSVHNDAGDKRRDKSGSVIAGSGKPKISVETVSGDISVVKD